MRRALNPLDFCEENHPDLVNWMEADLERNDSGRFVCSDELLTANGWTECSGKSRRWDSEAQKLISWGVIGKSGAQSPEALAALVEYFRTFCKHDALRCMDPSCGAILFFFDAASVVDYSLWLVGVCFFFICF